MRDLRREQLKPNREYSTYDSSHNIPSSQPGRLIVECTACGHEFAELIPTTRCPRCGTFTFERYSIPGMMLNVTR